MEDKDRDLDQLEQKINSMREGKKPKNAANINKGANLLIELLAAIIVGLSLGWYLDTTFDTKPLAIILCIIFGFLAAIKKIIDRK